MIKRLWDTYRCFCDYCNTGIGPYAATPTDALQLAHQQGRAIMRQGYSAEDILMYCPSCGAQRPWLNKHPLPDVLQKITGEEK